MTYQWADAEQTTIKTSDGRFIPALQGNQDYDDLIASGAEILPFDEEG
jgi:hypothetical protein